MELKNETQNKPCQATENQAIDEIIEYLNLRTGTSYRSDNTQIRQLIRTRLEEKYTLKDFQTVIDKLYYTPFSPHDGT
ncbi:conserved phage C-terminal domain-containing protein [Mobilibacterium timonense]|uniref:conserved phage C-terminal domain-containing protein n=1 Tax=Mobilibacterium timonense TaxID=1871012 RepID=UPI003AB9A53A